MQNQRQPSDKFNIGYNKSNEEYIQLLEEKNRIRKDSLNSREAQSKLKEEQKEKGFNLHINGANEERIKEQRRNEILNANSQATSGGIRGTSQNDNNSRVRRMWKNPAGNGSAERKQQQQEEVKQPSGRLEAHNPKYHNPFELQGRPPGTAKSKDGAGKARKKWGDQLPPQPHPLNIKMQSKPKEEEQQYSDSFEEIAYEIEGESSPQKQQEDDIDMSRQEEGEVDLEQFLKTCSYKDIDILKQSLNNFGLAKGTQNKSITKAYIEVQDDDNEYIEEEFEEVIESDNEDSDDAEQQRMALLEAQRKAQQQQVLKSKNVQTARNARNRPISATFQLDATKKPQGKPSYNPYESAGGSSYLNPSSQFMNSNFTGTNVTAQQMKPLGGGLMKDSQSMANLGGVRPFIQDTPKQPNDFIKKPINTNPFQRPFSTNIPSRLDAQKLKNVANKQETIEEDLFSEEDTKKKSIQQARVPESVTKMTPINSIIEKIEKLDEWKKEKLLELLESLDDSPKKNQPIQQNLNLKFLSPTTSSAQSRVIPAQKQQLQSIPVGKQELIIRVFNTYGNPHLCGLTEIEVFDDKANKVYIVPASIMARNLGQGPILKLDRLLDGHKLTNNEKHMWVGYLPLPPKNLEIVILLNKDLKVGGLKIWNYNKSAIDFTKGIQNIEVLQGILNQNTGIEEYNSLWKGSLERGKGHTNEEYATFITLIEGIELPLEIKPKAEVKPIKEPTQIIKEEVEDDEEAKQQEQMRKYKSEAIFPSQKPNAQPIWLDNAKEPLRPDKDSSKPLMSRRQQQQLPQTYDLLDKQVGQPASGVISQNPKSSLSKYDYQLPTKQDLKPENTRQQLQETSDAIKQAVSLVNNIFSQQQSKSVPSQRQLLAGFVHKPQPQIDIEESLDNLELFRATNLGRLLQNKTQGNQEEQAMKQSVEKKRSQYGMSPSHQRNMQDSQMSIGKQKGGAHVIVKNPFPIGMPTSTTNKSSRVDDDNGEDMLDQFLNKQGVGSSTLSKKEPIGQPNFITQNKPANLLGISMNEPIKPLQDDYLKPFSQPAILQQAIQLPTVNQKKVLTFEDKMKLFTKDFLIPTLPTGSKLEFNILSTWGDMNYVGLTGIELYDNNGQQIQLSETQISACPPDINILPGYGGDPRTIEKLVDGHYYTNDDLHVWLTPFTQGEDHTITIDLQANTTISMIRLWNYNKSRIHSYRGARLVTCELDGKMIFRGEIQKAPGNLNDPVNCCEIILFTDSEDIMSLIDDNDWLNEKFIQNSFEDTQRIMQEVPQFNDEERPLTATKKFNTAELEDIQRQLRQQVPTSLFDERPQTSAIVGGELEQIPPPLSQKSHYELSREVQQITSQKGGLRGRVIEINIIETWGDLFYVGLTGIEIIDQQGKIIPINISQVEADPRDMNSLGAGQGDYRTLDKLFDGVNSTMDDHHMWLIPYNKGEKHYIKIDLGKQTMIGAIRFYNYNKSEEDTLRGAKLITVTLDKKYLTPKKGIALRKGPGFVHPLMSMGQEFSLPIKSGWTTEQIAPFQKKAQPLYLFQEYELLNLPMGFSIKFNLFSTHGDFYYIGVNGIELYDQNGYLIKINHILAEPQGVHTLKGQQNDVRVVTNLINGNNQTFDEQNMWIAPFKNTRSYQAVTNAQQSKNQQAESDYRIPNYICIMFNEPKVISAVKLWNYSKTPSRGVNEFEILVDDKQIYRGFAKAAPERSDFDKLLDKDFSTVVLFSSEDKIVNRFQEQVHYDPQKQQSVMLINEKKVMNMNSMKQRKHNEEYAGVYNEQERPQTMVHRNF